MGNIIPYGSFTESCAGCLTAINCSQFRKTNPSLRAFGTILPNKKINFAFKFTKFGPPCNVASGIWVFLALRLLQKTSTILTHSGTTFTHTLLSLSVSLSYFCIGLVRGYSAPAVPSMNDINPGLLPSKNIASWVSSIPPFGALFGSLVAFPLMHKIGRKYTVMLTSPVWVTAWILIATAEDWKVLLIARMLSGFGAGLTLPSAQIYVSECSDPKIRGVIGSLPSLSMSAGILVIYVLGKYVEWRTLAWICCSVAVFLFIAVINFPQSPVWLKTKKRHEKAHNSAKWLHLQGFTFDPKAQEVQKAGSNGTTMEKKYKPFSKEALCRREVLLPLAIGLALLSIQQLSGIDAVIFFTVEIFRSAGSSLDGHLATIVVGAVQVLSNFAALFVVDRAGRKPLLIISGVIMSIAMASMGAAFYLNSIGNTDFGYLPVISLIVFMIGFSIGFGCIPFLLMGELFPTAQRSLLSSLAGSFNLAVMFVVIKTYHPLEDAISTSGTFWMYSILCAIGVVFVIAVVPETKGRDLETIHKLFEKRSSSATNNDNVEAGSKHGHDNAAMSNEDEIVPCSDVRKVDTKF